MSWAGRRRFLYLTGVIVFFLIVVGGPIAYKIATIPATCHDGIQNEGETSPDHGGPCLLLDASSLQPSGILWTRTFAVRSGLYDAVAYVDNPNHGAGVLNAPYELDLYDSTGVLVADLTGSTFIMSGGVTPIFVGDINTGNRQAIHAELQFTSPLVWERVVGYSQNITIQNEQITNAVTGSEITATAENTSVASISNITFIATVFDPSGNAIASSQTSLQTLGAGQSAQIFFTWPSAFATSVGRVDIIPVIAPVPDPTAKD